MACGVIVTPHGSCVVGPTSSMGGASMRLFALFARALLNQPSGTTTSPTLGMSSIVPRLSIVVWLKYAAAKAAQHGAR